MQLTNDAVTLESHARLQQRRRGQFAELALHVVGRLLGQAVDAHQLHGEVVIAAVDQRLLDQPPRCSVRSSAWVATISAIARGSRCSYTPSVASRNRSPGASGRLR